MTRARTALTCLVYIVLLVAVAVGIDRAISDRLFAHPNDYVPAYRSFQEYAVGVKLHEFESQHRRFSGLFLGNSRTMFGVDPPVVDAELGRRGVDFSSFNLALPSVDTRFWPPFFERYYDEPPPRQLFLGLLPRDLDASFSLGAREVQAFLHSAGFQNRNMSAVSSWAEESLARLFVLRGRLADTRLITLSDLLEHKKLDLNAIHLANDRGWAELPRGTMLPKSELAAQAQKLAVRHGSARFELGAEQRKSLVLLNSWIRSRGGCLTLFTTPLLFDAEPWGTIEMRRGFLRAMRRLVREIPGLRFVDIGARVQGGYGTADFADGDHLAPAGATRFSRQLADALLPSITDPGCQRPAIVARRP
ncbi:MAG TPA: hypothetical protein VF752_07500 [Thermoleophilaceae bacterium]